MLFNPRFGRIGMIAYPFFFFGEMMAPLVELLGYVAFALSIALGIFDVEFARLFFLAAIGYGLLTSLSAVLLEELSFRKYPRRTDLLRLLWFALLEPFGYRQLTVFYRVLSFWNYIRGSKRWGVMTREGTLNAMPADRSA